MPEKISHWCLLISVGLVSVGCRPTSKKEYPVIYDAWNARYQYNPLTREMQPFVDDKSIGRAWSRDEYGRLNSMYFFSGVNGRDEDLLQVHKKKLDKKRDKQWESERETRISQVKELLTLRESNQTKEGPVTPEVTEDAGDLVGEMDAFIPISNIETTLPGMDDQGMGLPEPAMGLEATSSEPSPFAPLPALP